MRQFLLATALILGAVGLFFGGRQVLMPAVAGSALGDMQAFQTIVTDVETIAATGDLVTAEVRITDLETAWDDAEATLKPKDPTAWGRVDDATDAVLSSLRAATPDAVAVMDALAGLQTVLMDPGTAMAGGITLVDGIAVTDASGRPIPCEVMLTAVKDGLAKAAPSVDKAAIDGLIVKASERCNADDDRNADAFSAAALKVLGQS